jgi:hypothetical protein
MQLQAFFNVGIVPDQRLSSRANVFVFCRVIDEGIVIETPVSLGSRGHRLGHIPTLEQDAIALTDVVSLPATLIVVLVLAQQQSLLALLFTTSLELVRRET